MYVFAFIYIIKIACSNTKLLLIFQLISNFSFLFVIFLLSFSVRRCANVSVISMRLLQKITLELLQNGKKPSFTCKKLVMNTNKCDLYLFPYKICCKID